MEYRRAPDVLTSTSQEGVKVKTGIHPATKLGTLTCSTCGTTFISRSTAGDLTVDTCSQCHPAYTGRVTKATTGSRVERFERRRSRAQ
jgi:large subunit ribosomal protein L31